MTLDYSGLPLVMAIVNCNGDSFFAASRRPRAEDACEAALKAEADGAAIVDFGGESTRPGSSYIDADEELRRVIPAIKLFRKNSRLPVSVDTRKSVVARAALDEGADIINDISALEDSAKMADLCARRGATVILMHKKQNPVYPRGVCEEVFSYLLERAAFAEKAGIARDKIILDPGIGFGKTFEDNAALLRRLAEITVKDYPVLIGLSRKSFVAQALSRDNPPPPEKRLAGTLAAHLLAVAAGAKIIRVHDVREHVETVKMYGVFSESVPLL